MILHKPSEEQKRVIDLLKNSNVICDSVAGSGKTTTVLNIAKNYSLEKILLLTYNSNLKIETREKAHSLMLSNLEVHSYHSYCVKYYDRNAFNDEKMKLIIYKDFSSKLQQYYHLIIIDECQDMTPLYYQLVKKIYRDNKRNNATLCVLGDRYQSIYDFAKADYRFISLADKIFTFNNKPWNKVVFNRSFRITHEMAEFVNNCMLKYDRITSQKISTEKPLYLICDSFHPRKNILNIIIKALQTYKPDDILILAPSLRSINSPCRKLENTIKNKIDVSVYVPISDEEKPDSEILKNKLVFLTFHQSKGLERKLVIVYGFDESYFNYYKKDADLCFSTNELYVATTRASEKLILVHHYQNDYLPFLNKEKIEKNLNIVQYNDLIVSSPTKPSGIYKEAFVTDLLRHIGEDVIYKASTYFTIKKVKDKGKFINLPLKVKEGENYESVSEINGIAIPSLYEQITKKKMTIKKYLLDNPKNLTKEEYKKYRDEEVTLPILLEIVIQYNSLISGYLFKTKQITNYNWLEENKVKECLERINDLKLGNQVYFEKKLEKQIENRKLMGQADIIDKNILYELKCTQTLEKEHSIQLALYTYMYNDKKYKNKNQIQAILYNILSGEKYELIYEYEKLEIMVKYLFYEKYSTKKKLSDNEFLEMIKNLH